jgi:EmrB/QacA subfamily drug resistance transporter
MKRPTPNTMAMSVVLAGTFMVVLDFFIVNVALPSIQRDFSASAGALEWIVAGYALTSGVLLVASAGLGDQLGRRRVFTVGLAVFTLASALCGAAWTPLTLIVARLVQGVGAALITPNVLALLTAGYSGDERVRAVKAYGLTMGIAALSGQLLGGGLIALDPFGLSWRSCFLINVPVGAVALRLASRSVAESRAVRSGSVDFQGTALLTAAVAALLMPLLEGRQNHWPLWSWLSLAVALIVGGVFVFHQRRRLAGERPTLLDLSLFRERSFSAALAAQLAFWSGQASYFLVLALYLQDGRSLNALHAGLLFTFMAVAYVVTSAAVPRLGERYGRRVLTVGALMLCGAHIVLLATVADIGVDGSSLALAPGLILAGFGMGLLIAPLTTIALSTVGADRAGSASAALTMTQSIGAALGVALIGVIFFGVLNRGYAHALELSLGALVLLLLAVACLAQLLPEAAREHVSAEPVVTKAA